MPSCRSLPHIRHWARVHSSKHTRRRGVEMFNCATSQALAALIHRLPRFLEKNVKRIRLITLLVALTVTLAAVVSPFPEQSVFSSRGRRAPEASAPKPVVTIPFKLVT